MQLPREVVIGNDILEFTSDLCKRFGFRESAFVVTGPHTQHIAGRSVIDLLEDAGIDVNYIIVSSSTAKNIEAVERKIKELKPQVVLGIGGGTKIDVAKLSSARQGVPFISVPTAACHDGIASPVCSLKSMNKPYSIMAQSPMAIVADTKIIVQAPPHFAASGCGDVVAKLTAIRDWRLAHKVRKEYYGEYAASLALMSVRLVLKSVDMIKRGMEEGLRVLLEALISCGVAMSIAGSSRPCSGSEHLFSHALDLIAPKRAMHGQQCSVGTIMMAYLHKMDWKYIKEKLQKVGAPTTAEELRIEPEHIILALMRARKIRKERYTILEEKRLSRDSAEKLAEATGVINR